MNEPASVSNAATPVLSVVVLSYRRRDLLRRVLRSVFAQDFENFEVIVVDNASDDGSNELVRREFPRAKLVELPENCGIRGRNVGFAHARGRYVLSLDDDIEFVATTAFKRIVSRFEACPRIGALTLKIALEGGPEVFADEHWWHPAPRVQAQDSEFTTHHINEAAVAFRGDALREAGYYCESMFWGAEAWDLVFGLMDLGYEVRYLPEPVLHLAPRKNINQQADPRHQLIVRNRCWTALRRLPLPSALAFIVPRLVVWGIRAVRYGYVGYYLRGVGDFLRAVPAILRSRQTVSRETLGRYRRVQSGREATQELQAVAPAVS